MEGSVESRRLIDATGAASEADEYRRAERRWQNEVGHALLEKPYEAPGATAVFERQWQRIAAVVRDAEPGAVIEVGCGKGHLLRWLRQQLPGPAHRFVGLDLSCAVESLPAHGLAGVLADGQWLPLRSGSAAVLIYDGALHHLIDYVEALNEALRVLAPGGLLVLFEPLSSPFTRLVHRLLDPLVFRKVVYESPIDQRYKDFFEEAAILHFLQPRTRLEHCEHTDVLAYPLTGCYAGSAFGRNARFMRAMIAVEELLLRIPLLGRLVRFFAWRFFLVARKPGPER
jgi:SAM-dependent methyltransferase